MRFSFVYLMTNQPNGVLYVGVTSDLVRRMTQHRSGLIEGFTKRYGLKTLVWFETHDEIVAAIGREKKISTGRGEKGSADPAGKSGLARSLAGHLGVMSPRTRTRHARLAGIHDFLPTAPPYDQVVDTRPPAGHDEGRAAPHPTSCPPFAGMTWRAIPDEPERGRRPEADTSVMPAATPRSPAWPPDPETLFTGGA
ncbi:GIY-YIG nuclease family protein [Hansschlegelia beijingensis]|uniref:GIY-YIG nuclease family protein n=1 Tax=Hansschlegelia beijingensis TaxID=1133344 RepID=UPI00388F547C